MNRKDKNHVNELSVTFTAQLILNAQRLGLVQIIYFLEGAEVTTLRLHVTEEPILFPTTVDTFRSTDLSLSQAIEQVVDIMQATLRNVAQGSNADVNLHRLSNGEVALQIEHKDGRWACKIVSDAS